MNEKDQIGYFFIPEIRYTEIACNGPATGHGRTYRRKSLVFFPVTFLKYFKKWVVS